MNILDAIIANKREEVAARKLARPIEDVRDAAYSAPLPRDFGSALVDPSLPAPRVIAEVKRYSPSKGPLRPDLDPAALASIYAQNGAAAISVLTDKRFFGGSLEYLGAVSRAVSLPVLCKEFIIDPYQLYEAREAGASAVLLIASVLATGQLRAFREEAASLGMASLVEVHNETELASTLDSGAQIVGINNRDLRTFKVSLDTTRLLLRDMPAGIVTVSESGIHTASDRQLMADVGVDALLVGESLITSEDTAHATRLICGLQPALETSAL